MFPRSGIALLGGAVFICLSASMAPAECLRDGEPLNGELREVRTEDVTGQPVTSFQVVSREPVCIEIEAGQGSDEDTPQTLEDVRSVEIVLEIAAESLELSGLIGAEVEARGRFAAPVETVHTGDAVLMRASVVPIEGATAPERQATDVDPDGELDQKIERFVRGFYLSGKAEDAEQLRLLYAPRVHYFGKDDVSISEIVRDKINYYRRWPTRVFALIDGTLDVRRIEQDGEVYDVAFEYDFEVRRSANVSRGRGVAILTIDLNDGEGRIVRETGRVLKRM